VNRLFMEEAERKRCESPERWIVRVP
jgi:hypothetical protein